MTNFFLKAKHWWLFIITIGIPMIFYMVFFFKVMNIMLSNYPNDSDPQVMWDFFSIMKFLPLIILISSAGFLMWMWSLGVGLQDKIPKTYRLNTFWFKLTVIFIIVYLAALSTFISSLLGDIKLEAEGSRPFNPTYWVLIIPMHLLTFIGMFYAMYFSAKTFRTAELQRKITLSEFGVEFVLIWFYFIGVWFIQPRVNKIMAKSSETPL